MTSRRRARQDHLIWPKYPNVLLFHRLRLYHDSRFNLHCMTLLPILIMYRRRLGRGRGERDGLEEIAGVDHRVC